MANGRLTRAEIRDALIDMAGDVLLSVEREREVDDIVRRCNAEVCERDRVAASVGVEPPLCELGAPCPVVIDDYVDSEGVTVPLLYDPEPGDAEDRRDLPSIVQRLLDVVHRQQETIARLNSELARASIWDELELGIDEMEHEQQQGAIARVARALRVKAKDGEWHDPDMLAFADALERGEVEL